MKSGKSRSLSRPGDFTDVVQARPNEPAEAPGVDGAEMERLLIDVVLGRSSTVTTEAAGRFRDQLVREVREIEEAGYVVDIPGEFPDCDLRKNRSREPDR